MARWKDAAPEPAGPVRVNARDRFRLMAERDTELLALPVVDHDAFLKEFYANRPEWPFASASCGCARCVTKTTKR